MELDRERAAFICSPVMIVIGTRDEANAPEIGRGVGARVAADGAVEIVLSGWQWPATVRNLRQTGTAAAVFARPADYVAYQLKGGATVRPADTDDLALADSYIAATCAMLQGLGMPPDSFMHWLMRRDPVVLRLAAAELFEQTPGARAGRRLEAPA